MKINNVNTIEHDKSVIGGIFSKNVTDSKQGISVRLVVRSNVGIATLDLETSTITYSVRFKEAEPEYRDAEDQVRAYLRKYNYLPCSNVELTTKY